MLQRIKISTIILIFLISSRLSVVVSFGALFLCNHIPSLSPKQRQLCESYPDVMGVIGEGTRLGIGECEHQFRFSRWNCTPPTPEAQFNHAHVVVTGSREAAFLYAITSSGVTYAITQACGRGNISSCGCAPPTTSPTHSSPLVRRPGSGTTEEGDNSAMSTWRWGGCSPDVDFALGLTRKFIDAREVEGDARSLMNLHNNKAGRKMVESTLETECKCHGVSGSCTLKTCWFKLPTFREIGDKLLLKYEEARPVVAVQGAPQGPRFRRSSMMLLLRPKPSTLRRAHLSGSLERMTLESHSQPHLRHLGRKGRERKRSLKDKGLGGHQKKSKPRRTELVYLEQSPNYCEEDRRVGSLGTRGRKCLKREASNRSLGLAQIQESCDILCCGRGYNTHHILSKWKCGCKFRWCCEVQCQNCQEQIEILTCK